MTTLTELEAAVERVTATMGVRGARFIASDVRTLLHALAEANERASLLQTAVHERCAERDEARKALAEARDEANYFAEEAQTVHEYHMGQRDALSAALAAHQALPDGWVLVPRDPTMRMLHHGDKAQYGATAEWLGRDIYRAMIAAAPEAPPRLSSPTRGGGKG